MHSASKRGKHSIGGGGSAHKGEGVVRTGGHLGGSFGSAHSANSAPAPVKRVNATARMKVLLQNENLAQLTEEVEERDEINVDDLIVTEEKKLYENKLKELRLCEKIGINGEVMLYPKKEKEKKWYNGEYESMVNQLYQVKYVDQYRNLSDPVRKELESDKLGSIADIREREKKIKHENELYWKKIEEKIHYDKKRPKSIPKSKINAGRVDKSNGPTDPLPVRSPKVPSQTLTFGARH